VDSPSQAQFYDFGLSSAQEAHASRLHHECIVFDFLSQHAGANIFSHYSQELQALFESRLATAGCLADAFLEAIYWPYELSLKDESNLIADWYHQSGLTCGTYGIDVHDGSDTVALRLESLVQRYATLPWMRYVTNTRGIREAKRQGVVAFYGGCQPTNPLPRDLSLIDRAYAKGLRSLMLTYNLMDNVGVGCTERVDAGLSRFGVRVVERCNGLGIIVDVSHCGHMTTLDACRYSKRPVTANHTAAQSVYRHVRGKRDDALKAVASTGGVIGVVALPSYLTSEVPTIEHMLDHIEYIADLVGWEHVSIGTDWPLQVPESILERLLSPANEELGFQVQDAPDVTKRLLGYDDVRDLPNITRGLVRRGYDDSQIRGILGENALRVFEAVCG